MVGAPFLSKMVNMGPSPLDRMSNSCQIPCCRILEPLEAFSLCMDHDPVCFPRKPPMLLIPFEHAWSQTMTFCGKYPFVLTPPLLFAWTRLEAQTRSF